MASNETLNEREKGQFPLSIATSLAFEGILGIYPEREIQENVIRDYSQLWVNLRTLFRNFLGSISKDDQNSVMPNQMVPYLIQEMETIADIVRDNHPNMEVIYYVSNYTRMEQRYPYAVIRKDRTPKQIEYTTIQNTTITSLLKEIEKQGQINVLVFDRKLKAPRPGSKAVVITHYPYDLTSYSEFMELALLESHTGVVKKRGQFYTKFLNGKELPMIPWRTDMLEIFGDGQTFHPMDRSVREELVEIAKKNNWNQMTTNDRIKLGVELMKNEYAKQIILKILER